MTDRINGYIVTLEERIREDDAEATLNALRMIKGVLSVTPVVGNVDQLMAEQRVRARLEMKLAAVLRDEGEQ
jgi:hypothetical protein